MTITVNGQKRQVRARDLAELVHELQHDGTGVATARNHEFVRAVDRSQTVLAEGDEIEIVAPQQGG